MRYTNRCLPLPLPLQKGIAKQWTLTEKGSKSRGPHICIEQGPHICKSGCGYEYDKSTWKLREIYEAATIFTREREGENLFAKKHNTVIIMSCVLVRKS